MTVTQLHTDTKTGGGEAPAIETHKLTKVYPGGVRAVNELDLLVQRGEIFGLLGPNGAGKTTTAGMLTTRVVPTSGTAFVGGVDVIHHPSEAKRLFGVVAQTNTLDRSLTVWENLYFHGRFFGMPAKFAKSESTRLLEQFRLAERAKADVMALSGGMAQRLMVARAVMHRPAVLFLDEPTAGLDPIAAAEFDELVLYLQRTLGLTVVMVTHDLDTLTRTCDRVAVLVDGKVIVDTLGNIVENDHPWIRDYFHGARGRAVFDAREAGRGT